MSAAQPANSIHPRRSGSCRKGSARGCAVRTDRCRLLKAHDLITGPAFIAVKAVLQDRV